MPPSHEIGLEALLYLHRSMKRQYRQKDAKSNGQQGDSQHHQEAGPVEFVNSLVLPFQAADVCPQDEKAAQQGRSP